MQRKHVLFILILPLLCILCVGSLIGGPILWNRIRPQPGEVNQELFQGINYIRDVRVSPRPMVVHIVTIDLREPGIAFLVTPGDPQTELPLKARTTSSFLNDFNLQLAINGDAFSPWHSNGILDYYPHSGDPVDPVGFAASNGEVYSQTTDDEPVLYISKTNRARFNQPPGNIYNAISGNQMLINRGQPLPDNENNPQPRTAVGLDKNMRTLIIIVVDGRQPGYSEGATKADLSEILAEFGAHNAMNLDGGGSSTLVKEGLIGRSSLLNSPIEHQIPNRQRVVGNHLGIYADPVGGE